MKIVNKILLANLMHIIALGFVFLFAYHSMNQVLTKMHFMEAADDLNASLLEIRLSEKNLFLYHDLSALSEIENKTKQYMQSLESMRKDAENVIGPMAFDQLSRCLKDYQKHIEAAGQHLDQLYDMEQDIRGAGQKLREYSQHVVAIEQNKVNKIITRSKHFLFTSFFVILLGAIGLSHLSIFKILRSLKKIERLANLVSEGNFGAVEPSVARDEVGSVMRAIYSMSQELEKRQEVIVQSKKLESLGILTAGVAHELGNPLNNISMMAQTYIELAPGLGQEDCLDYMNKINEETERIETVVRDLLSFSKLKKRDFKPNEVNAVVEKSIKLVNNMLRVSSIEKEVELAEDLPLVVMDKNRIQEVLINLMTNSIQSMSPGGKLFIRTRLEDQGETVAIDINDTGQGIPKEFLSHIFDPFFSTKGVDGTGLGLSVSYGIVKNHKGTMDVKSQVGKGTEITVRFPAFTEIPEDQGGKKDGPSKNHDH